VRFKRLAIGGFGRLPSGLVLEFGPGLNLIIAPNESGKTTCADLISGLFYGFGNRSQGVHFYEPWSGGETGAELVYYLSGKEQEFTLSRQLQRRGEKVSWRDSEGRELNTVGVVPGEVHLGQSRGVFNTVSRIRLDDLQDAFGGENPKEKNQTQNELLGFFFQEAATMGQVANPVQVRQAWQDQQAYIYSKDRRRGKQDQAIREKISQAEAELAQARHDEEQADRHQSELEDIAIRLDQMKRQQAVILEERKQAQKQVARSELWTRARNLDLEIDQLASMGTVDEESYQRTRDLNNRIKARIDAYGESQAKAKQAKQQAEELLEGRDSGKWASDLDEATRLLAGLEVRYNELNSRQNALAEQASRICAPWGVSLAALAGMSEDWPRNIEACQHEVAQARDQAAEADELLAQASGGKGFTAKLWDWGLILMLSGFAFSWFSGLSGNFGLWFLLGGGLMAVGLIISLIGRRAKGDRAYFMELEKYREDVQAHLAGITRHLSQTAKPLKMDPMQINPALLAQAGEDAKPVMQASGDLTSDNRKVEEQFLKIAGLVQNPEAHSLEDLSVSLQEQRELQAKAAQADEQQRRRFAELKAQEMEIQVQEGEYQALLDKAGVKDNAELQNALNRTRRIKELKAKKEELESQISREDSQAEEIDLATAQARLTELEQRHSGLEEEISRLTRERGRLEQALKHLAQATSAAQAEERLSSLKAERGELARRHDTLALAGLLLGKSLDHYRMESQPSLLKKAGGYFAEMTQGAYKWLGSDIFQNRKNQPPRLMAQKYKGSSERQAAALSRGTQDQLYLCLRLALADETMAGGELVPLILDDPLVNFDDDRMKSALDLIIQVADKRQVLLFTCHNEQAQMLSGHPHTKLSLFKGTLL
jgi:uncharacterized protein YhaN